jgi:hypothetical protein
LLNANGHQITAAISSANSGKTFRYRGGYCRGLGAIAVFEVMDDGIVKKSVACIETLRVNRHRGRRYTQLIVLSGWKLRT